MVEKNLLRKILNSLVFLVSLMFSITSYSVEENENTDFEVNEDIFKTVYFSDLSKIEKAKVFKIISNHSDQRKELNYLLNKSKKELIENIFSKASQADLKDNIQKVNDAKANMMIFRINVLSEILAILPTEYEKNFKKKLENYFFKNRF